MKKFVTLPVAALVAVSLTACSPALTSESLEVSLASEGVSVVLGKQANFQVKVDVFDDSVSKDYFLEVTVTNQAGDKSVLGEFEAQGDFNQEISFAPQAGDSNLKASVTNRDGSSVAESDELTIGAIDGGSFSGALAEPPAAWLIDYPLSFSLDVGGDTTVSGVRGSLEFESDGTWVTVGEAEPDFRSVTDISISEEGEETYRFVLYLDGEVLAMSDNVSVLFKSPSAFLTSLAYGSQQASMKGAQASLDYTKSTSYPGLYDFDTDFYAESIKENLSYDYVDYFVVKEESVRTDPDWVLPTISCQLASIGVTPTGKSFIFEAEFYASDKYGNDYPVQKANRHGTFFDGKMWLYEPPCAL
jgi:hypothetical protein